MGSSVRPFNISSTYHRQRRHHAHGATTEESRFERKNFLALRGGALMMPATLARHQWTSADYERMLAAGMFEKIELLCGDVVITGARVRPYRWTLDDYEQLIALGLLEGKHVELIQGEILIMASMGEPHALTIMQLNYALLPHFNPGTG